MAKAISGATSAGGGGPSSSRGLEVDVGILRLVTVLEDVATLMVCSVTLRIRMVTGQMLKPSPREPATTASLALFEAGNGHERRASL